jgi:hypothetical protein
MLEVGGADMGLRQSQRCAAASAGGNAVDCHCLCFGGGITIALLNNMPAEALGLAVPGALNRLSCRR